MKEILSKFLDQKSNIPNMIPNFNYHVTDRIVDLEDNFLIAVLSVDGMMFEAISESVLETEFNNLNLAFAESTKDKGGRLAFWCTLKRRKTNIDNDYIFENDFAKSFSDKYMNRFNDKDYYDNSFYITLCMRYDEGLKYGIDEMEELCDKFQRLLLPYKPEFLEAYENIDPETGEGDGVVKSETYDFFAELISNESLPFGLPVTQEPLSSYMASSDIHFGYDEAVSKGEYRDRYLTVYDLKSYPKTSRIGMFNSALSLEMEYNLTQSFTSFSGTKAFEEIERQINKLRSAQDRAEHELEELQHALGYIQSGELAFGRYHCVLVVFGKTRHEAVKNGMTATANFANSSGAVFKRAKGSAPATYLSQIPLFDSKLIPRPMMKSSQNLASTFSMQNYSKGKAKGNPLGDGSALMPLQTKSKTVYQFNFHYTNEHEDNIGDSIAGHTLVLGATGTGKTTTQSAMITFAQRFDPAMFVLDKDRGMEIFIRALDGDYFTIKSGQPTGINPFQFATSYTNTKGEVIDLLPKLKDFLNDLVITCASNEITKCSSEEKNQIKMAIDTVMELPFEQRRFSAIMQSLPDRGGDTLKERLRQWVNTDTDNGRLAWALDNPSNTFNPTNFKIVGFDVSDLLREGYEPSSPLLGCLFYMKEMMVMRDDIRDIICVVEEFWLPLKFKMTQEFILDVLKTGRKRFEIMMLVSQSPADAIKSPIFDAIKEQIVTQVLLPNPNAEYTTSEHTGYDRLGLTEKEFKQLKALSLASRTFLIKQGTQSAFAMLDLYGFGDEIAVLSSDKANIELLNYIRALIGDDVKAKDWLPIFHQARALRKEQGKLLPIQWERIIKPVVSSKIDNEFDSKLSNAIINRLQKVTDTNNDFSEGVSMINWLPVFHKAKALHKTKGSLNDDDLESFIKNQPDYEV